VRAAALWVALLGSASLAAAPPPGPTMNNCQSICVSQIMECQRNCTDTKCSQRCGARAMSCQQKCPAPSPRKLSAKDARAGANKTPSKAPR
jgi:hypothetical protein